MDNILERHKEIWEQKKILRIIYQEWYEQILNDLKADQGKTVELGAGSGNFKEYKPDVVSADIEPCAWLDMCFDAHDMPFTDKEVANIVMIDVLHHLADPVKFFQEAYRVLQTGGRILLVEPFPSPFSKIIYKLFHPEPFIYAIDYFSRQSRDDKEPWEANQAISYLLFFKQIDRFKKEFKGKFKIVKKSKMSFLLYPASGGFENKQLIPNFLIPLFKVFEKILTPLRSLLAFRCYVVVEKL